MRGIIRPLAVAATLALAGCADLPNAGGFDAPGYAYGYYAPDYAYGYGDDDCCGTVFIGSDGWHHQGFRDPARFGHGGFHVASGGRFGGFGGHGGFGGFGGHGGSADMEASAVDTAEEVGTGDADALFRCGTDGPYGP
jgi:hypothetical protein